MALLVQYCDKLSSQISFRWRIRVFPGTSVEDALDIRARHGTIVSSACMHPSDMTTHMHAYIRHDHSYAFIHPT